MTREDRLDEIADYILFLEEVRKKLSWEKNLKSEIILLGFSQGVSTLLRWMHDRHPHADHLLLWAGGIPDDISFEFSKTYFENINAHYFVGDEDEYYLPERKPELLSLLASTGMKAEFHLFSGSHRIEEDELKKWILSLG
jgi:predicted esterase